VKPWLLVFALLVTPAFAEDYWILQSGPQAVESIPLDPVQPVPSWRGLYSDGDERVWLYATQSAQFFAPSGARRVSGTPWTVVPFFPETWSVVQRSTWFDRWVAEFLSLASLPRPSWPIQFPAVLKKG